MDLIIRIAYVVLIFLHGLIHVSFFIKPFGNSNFIELTNFISKIGVLISLLALISLICYGLSILANIKYSWAFGMFAVLVSQVVIIYFWTDGKTGTFPNIIILIVVLCSLGEFSFNKKVKAETSALLSGVSKEKLKIINENDIKDLPMPVKKWIRTTGIIGKEEIKVACIKQKALMKIKPSQKEWFIAKAKQYSFTQTPAFIWSVDLSMMPLVSIRGRDKYVEGKGEMLIKINSLLNVVNERGHKLDEGTLQRFLGELVWMPSLALSPHIEWEDKDELSSKATIRYKGCTGSGIFYFNESGDFIKFVANRYRGNTENSRRIPWVLTVEEYSFFEGIKIPSKMKATWKLDNEDWTWLDLEIIDLKFNNI